MDPVILENVKQAALVMLWGMGGVFAVLFLIYLSIKALLKLFPAE